MDFEALHLAYVESDSQHSGIIVIPQKNAYDIAKRVGVLLHHLTVKEIFNQLLYA